MGADGRAALEAALLPVSVGTMSMEERLAARGHVYSISGVLHDSQNLAIKIGGASIKFYDLAHRLVVSATSDSSGKFSLNSPAGTFAVSVHADGYVDIDQQQLNVQGSIDLGTSADLAMSKEVPVGEWRAVLTWNGMEPDLDTHVKFGVGLRKQVYYGRKDITDSSTGIHVSLDVDDTSYFGPETATMNGVGSCTAGSDCKIEYSVKRYSSRSELRNADVLVTLYGDNQIKGVFSLNDVPVGQRRVTVFTLDASNGNVQGGCCGSGAVTLASGMTLAGREA